MKPQEEMKKNYAEVGERFKVIEGDTVLVIADENMKQRIHFGYCNWQEIQRKAIPMRLDRVKKLSLPMLTNGNNDWDCLYDWNLSYDSFLGIMAGILANLHSKNGFLVV